MCPPVRSDAVVNGLVMAEERLWIFGQIARDTHNDVLEPRLIVNLRTAKSEFDEWQLDAGRMEWEVGD